MHYLSFNYVCTYFGSYNSNGAFRFDTIFNYIPCDSNRIKFHLNVFLFYPELSMYKCNDIPEAINCIN